MHNAHQSHFVIVHFVKTNYCLYATIVSSGNNPVLAVQDVLCKPILSDKLKLVDVNRKNFYGISGFSHTLNIFEKWKTMREIKKAQKAIQTNWDWIQYLAMTFSDRNRKTSHALFLDDKVIQVMYATTEKKDATKQVVNEWEEKMGIKTQW